ncbi:unnamed protein product [Symbiodinium sp. CCMP2592]|nr:unnamed protein product [Symbiodinium sp. CCMP2592]
MQQASEEDASSEDDDDGSDEDDEVFKAKFRAMKPSAVANLLQAIESHELYPFYCEYREPDGKFAFGPDPVDDVLKWNSWLDKHGATVRTQLAAKSAAAATSVGHGPMAPTEVPRDSKEAGHGPMVPAKEPGDSKETGHGAVVAAEVPRDSEEVGSIDGQSLSDDDSASSASLQKLVDASREVELSSSDGSDSEKPKPRPKRSLEIKTDAADVVPSKFTIDGVAALDVNRVQNAALEAASKPVLTPQEQLKMLKNQREKNKPKKETREEQKEGLAVYESGWMKVKIQAAKAKNGKPKDIKPEPEVPRRIS